MSGWPSAMPLALLAVAAGCSKIPKNTSLTPPSPAADHVALEVFFVRIAAGDKATTGPLWAALDEQAVPLEARRQLAANGFIVGQVAGQLPAAVTELLQLSDDAPLADNTQPPVIDLSKKPLIHRKLIDVYQIETPNRIVVTGERERHAKLNVLLRDENDDGAVVRGWTFTNAQGCLVTKVRPQPDGRVRLEIVPEVEHGEAHREITPDEGGSFAIVHTPPRKTFDGLRLTATLTPGEMLVLSCRDGRPGSLGHQFFTERRSDAFNQIVLLIRVVQAKADDLFIEK